MKNLLKITAIFCVATYFYLIFYPIEILNKLNLNSPDPSSEDPITVLEQANSNYLIVNIGKINKINIVSISRTIIHNFKPILKSYDFLLIKTYQKNTDLFFNNPLICYKHPLSEYTAEG